MLDAHSGWDAARLDLLRLLVQSADRALALTDDDERRRETRTLIGIYKTLNLRTDGRTDSAEPEDEWSRFEMETLARAAALTSDR